MNPSNSSTTPSFPLSSAWETGPGTTIALSLAAHSQAQRFRQQHAQPAKAKQVYLNTLAIYAVKTYVERAGFDVDLAAGISWDVAQQTLLDVADLKIQGHGVVECRPILPQQTGLHVPPEVWSVESASESQGSPASPRQGYVAVLLDPSLKSATLLGFIDQVHQSDVPLSELLPIEDLMSHVLGSSVSESPIEMPHSVREADGPIRLQRWLTDLQDTVETGWQHLDQWLAQPRASDAQVAWGFRNESAPSGISNSNPAVIRSKSVTVGSSSNPVNVALTVGIIGDLEQPSQKREICVQVTPSQLTSVLPPHLVLKVLDNAGDVVMQAQSRSTEAMQLRFGVDSGELFCLQLTLDDVSMTESFIL